MNRDADWQPEWDRVLWYPIEARGLTFRTLREVGDYIEALPEETQQLEHWHTVAGAIMLQVQHDADNTLAAIAVRQALAIDRPEPASAPTPRRKNPAKKYRIVH